MKAAALAALFQPVSFIANYALLVTMLMTTLRLALIAQVS